MNTLISFAKNTNILLQEVKNNVQIVGGCTQIEEFPQRIVSTFGMKELSQIARHERYLDIGPGVTLSDIIALGQNHIPQILYEAINSIANPIIRNMATIGGNIFAQGNKHTLYAPLLALDTKLDFKNQYETKSISLSSFTTIPEGFYLANIRIPSTFADLYVFRRIGPEHSITQQSASFAFFINTDNNSITSIKLAFAGPVVFRSKELENTLIGRHLPLSRKEINQLQEMVQNEFNKTILDKMISDVLKQQFLNLTRYSFEQLT